MTANSSGFFHPFGCNPAICFPVNLLMVVTRRSACHATAVIIHFIKFYDV